MGLVECRSRGTQVIVEDCQRAGCPEPNYSLKGGCFVVTFPVGPELKPDSRAESRSVLKALAAGPLARPRLWHCWVGRG